MKQKSTGSFRFPISTIAGSSFSNLIRISWGRPLIPALLPRYVLSALVSMILQPFRIYEGLRWNPRLNTIPLPESPIFIIGFWRSGTTLMHNLISLDDRFSYVTTFQGIFPHLLLSCQRWMKPLINSLVPAERPADHVELNLDYPQEEEFALGNIHPWSFYNFWYFPQSFEEYRSRFMTLDGLTSRQLEEWKKHYCNLVRKCIINTGGESFVSKNPVNTCRIPLLLDTFPSSRFIFMKRDPYDVYASSIRFFTPVIQALQFNNIPVDELSRQILVTYREMLNRYRSTRTLIPEGRLIEVRFEDLYNDKPGSLERIYYKLGLGESKASRMQFYQYLESSRRVKPAAYQHSAATIEMVNAFLGNEISDLGYDIR